MGLVAALAAIFDLTSVEFIAAAIAVALVVTLAFIALRPAKSLLTEHEPAGVGASGSRRAGASSGAALVGRSGPHAGSVVPVPKGGLTLGRDARGPGSLNFDARSDVSRRHCLVVYDAVLLRFKVTDLGSSNGTFLMPSGRKLAAKREVVCRPGQVIRLGEDNVFELKAD